MESGSMDSQANSAVADEEPGHAEDELKEVVASAPPIYHLAPRTHSRTYLAAPNHPFETFSGCDPNDLHMNIIRVARTAPAPPFLHGRFQAVQGLPSSVTDTESIDPRLPGTIDPRLAPIAREWEYGTSFPRDHASWEKAPQEQPRYEPWLDPNLEQQDRAAKACEEHSQPLARDEADEYGETQQELAELASSAVAIVRHDPTIPGRRLYHSHPQTRPAFRAPPTALRRKTTNASPPSQPPPDTTYSHGTLPISPEILSLVTQIKSLPRKHKKGSGGGGGYPMPTKLRSIPGMNSRNGYMSKSSPLMKWYGDTRLFTEKWWKWLYVGGKARRELERELGESDEL
ncbi:hypothetical protein Slin15195_G128600 [Septoria linicola]|uniref:Uncharacterized protein n=1 Tax=Septoria linicola TaxID=215465 RepID=A0A9Q9B9I9_9PEZI|nr:hypothetical protein Slin15195_G128600 [Septoria linicola]